MPATSNSHSDRLDALLARGVKVMAPLQTFIDDDVDLDRIASSAVLYPGTRLHGNRTYLGPNCRVGTEGPAVLVDVVLGERATVASGYAEGAVLLRDAKLGANSHVRSGTVLEEQASSAHCVGMKQTILLSFVTLGSLINFCDVLMAGGTSRKDHSEVGSGYIHFNFTPWGKSGDKATPSLVGEVVHGVFLDRKRIFLGGSSGLVGPTRVGYGSIAAAGQVVRKDIADDRLVLSPAPQIDMPLRNPSAKRVAGVLEKNAAYIGQVTALVEWYRQVRLARVPEGAENDHLRIVLTEAIAQLEFDVAERQKRLDNFLLEYGHETHAPRDEAHSVCPMQIIAGQGPIDHVEWVKSLAPEQAERGRIWLQSIVDRTMADIRGDGTVPEQSSSDSP